MLQLPLKGFLLHLGAFKQLFSHSGNDLEELNVLRLLVLAEGQFVRLLDHCLLTHAVSLPDHLLRDTHLAITDKHFLKVLACQEGTTLLRVHLEQLFKWLLVQRVDHLDVVDP